MSRRKQEKALLPELRFPEFAGEWESKTFGELFKQGQTKGGDDMSLLSLTAEDGIIPQSESGRKDNSNTDKSRYLRVSEGDIAYNTMRMWEGRSALSTMEGLVSPAYTVCTPKKGTHSKFFSYFIKTSRLIEQFYKNSQGLTKDTYSLKYAAFAKIRVSIPTKPEQQKIADCLGSLDELIAARSAKLAALQDHKKGLLQQLFPAPGQTTPKLRFPGFEGEWEEKPISDYVLSIQAGVSVNAGDRPACETEVGVLKTSAVTKGNFHPHENKVVGLETEQNRLTESVTEGVIIICRKNTPALVGANVYVETSYQNLFLPDLLWAMRPRAGVSLRHLSFVLSSDRGRAALYSVAKGSSTSMINITKPEVLALEFPTPPPAEQQKIASCLSSLDAIITAETDHIAALKQHKKGLMQKLFPNPEHS